MLHGVDQIYHFSFCWKYNPRIFRKHHRMYRPMYHHSYWSGCILGHVCQAFAMWPNGWLSWQLWLMWCIFNQLQWPRCVEIFPRREPCCGRCRWWWNKINGPCVQAWLMSWCTQCVVCVLYVVHAVPSSASPPLARWASTRPVQPHCSHSSYCVELLGLATCVEEYFPLPCQCYSPLHTLWSCHWA